MDNIKLQDLRSIATLKEVGEAFGVSISQVKQWEVLHDDIPPKYRWLYHKGELPDGKKKALALYKRALRNMRAKAS